MNLFASAGQNSLNGFIIICLPPLGLRTCLK